MNTDNFWSGERDDNTEESAKPKSILEMYDLADLSKFYEFPKNKESSTHCIDSFNHGRKDTFWHGRSYN